jgi:glycosyltransferase involved in cell wall biosynthesis
VVENARAIVVHNRAAAARVEALRPTAPVHVLPHLLPVADPPPAQDIALWRTRHGLDGCFAIAVFGHLRPTKRIAILLRVLEKLRPAYSKLRLVLAGEAVSAEYEESLGGIPGAVRLSYQDEAAFRLSLAAVDAVVSLRYPSSAETSGITLRAMAEAKPVLVTAGDEHAALPAGAVCPIEAGVGESEHLALTLALLIENPSYGRTIGAAARQHIATAHHPDTVARRLLDCLRATIR